MTMGVTREQVLALLRSDEPDFTEAEEWGPDATTYVEEFARSDDPYLASGAVYLAGLIPCDRSLAILAEAAHRHDPETRMAAAEAARQLAIRGATPTQLRAAEPALRLLLADPDAGVRRIAARAAEQIRQVEIDPPHAHASPGGGR
jgi:HEAT repeat protein